MRVLRRCWPLAVLGVLAALLVPAPAATPAPALVIATQPQPRAASAVAVGPARALWADPSNPGGAVVGRAFGRAPDGSWGPARLPHRRDAHPPHRHRVALDGRDDAVVRRHPPVDGPAGIRVGLYHLAPRSRAWTWVSSVGTSKAGTATVALASPKAGSYRFGVLGTPTVWPSTSAVFAGRR